MQTNTAGKSLRERLVSFVKSNKLQCAISVATSDGSRDDLKSNLELLCKILMRFGRYKEQLYVARQLMSWFPEDPAGWSHASLALISQGEDAKAKELLLGSNGVEIPHEYQRLIAEKSLRIGGASFDVALGNIYPLDSLSSGFLSIERMKASSRTCRFDIAQSFGPSAAIMACQDVYICSSHGAHASSGVQFMHSTLGRAYYLRDCDVPYGGYSNIGRELLDKANVVYDYGFFIRSIDFNRFGHILTETVASIYPIVYCYANGIGLSNVPLVVPSRFRLQAKHFMAMLNLDPSMVVFAGTDNPIVIRKLLIPVPTLILQRGVSPQHMSLVRHCLELSQRVSSKVSLVATRNRRHQRFEPPMNEQGKLFISRSQSQASRTMACEVELENVLQAAGWSIFHPQEQSVDKQLSIYSEATHIAGCWGSAFHLLMGLEKVSCSVTLLVGDPLWKEHRRTYESQFEAQNLPARYIECLASDGRLREGWSVSMIAESLEGVC